MTAAALRPSRVIPVSRPPESGTRTTPANSTARRGPSAGRAVAYQRVLH
ncbi:MAG: hypothetical protein JWQ37_3737, partial [Blastococcus sp.]|nr:hypothetical protein [Blastococcus sp.]